MKDKRTIFFATTCIIVLILLFYLCNELTTLRSVRSYLLEENSAIQTKSEIYRMNFELNNRFAGNKISDVLCVADKDVGIQLSSLASKEYLLIYRFTHESCSECYKQEIHLIQDIFADCPQLVNILCSYYTTRDFYILKKTEKLKIPILQISLNALDWMEEKHNASYYFVLHPDMRVSHIYVPEEQYPELSKRYLEGVKRYLSSQNESQ